jgi:NDP-sugar pyrophosphorylase family protein
MAMHALILAAGAGRRIWPFGETQAKALLPVGDQCVLSRLLQQVRALGAEARVVAGGPHARAVRGFCTSSGGAVVVQGGEGGTAEAALAAWPVPCREPVLCVYGDVWLGGGVLPALVAQAAEDPEAAHLLAVPLGAERPQDWLCVEVGDGGRVHGLTGHPRGGRYRSGGAFVLPAGFDRLLRANPGRGVRVPVGGMPPAEACLEESLNLWLDEGRPVRALVTEEPALDLDKPWHLLAANRAAVRERLAGADDVVLAPGARVDATADLRAPVVLEAGAEIGARVIVRAPLYLCAGARITDGAIVAGPSLLGPAARVSDYARLDGAVLGPGAVVGHAAEVVGVVMRGAHIVHYSEIYGVVGREVDIGAATVCGTLRFDDGASRQWVGATGGPGRWETPADDADAAYFGDFSRTGVNVTLLPGRVVGPYACVGPGVVVAEDVPARTLLLLRQQLEQRPWGPERYGW